MFEKFTCSITGIIREVSLVLAGANPGAFIDDVVVHGDGESGIILGYDEIDVYKRQDHFHSPNAQQILLHYMGHIQSI